MHSPHSVMLSAPDCICDTPDHTLSLPDDPDERFPHFSQTVHPQKERIPGLTVYAVHQTAHPFQSESCFAITPMDNSLCTVKPLYLHRIICINRSEGHP